MSFDRCMDKNCGIWYIYIWSQSVLKEINPEYSLEGLMLNLILWPPDAKSQLIGKDPDAGKDWRQEEKGMTEDAMVEWHHWISGHEFEQMLREIVNDREAWHATVHGVTKSWMWLGNWMTIYMLHTHGILLSYRRWNNAICSNMDGPRDYHTKWSQKETHYTISLICEI